MTGLLPEKEEIRIIKKLKKDIKTINAKSFSTTDQNCSKFRKYYIQ